MFSDKYTKNLCMYLVIQMQLQTVASKMWNIVLDVGSCVEMDVAVSTAMFNLRLTSHMMWWPCRKNLMTLKMKTSTLTTSTCRARSLRQNRGLQFVTCEYVKTQPRLVWSLFDICKTERSLYCQSLLECTITCCWIKKTYTLEVKCLCHVCCLRKFQAPWT